MKRPRRSNAVAYALYANAAVLFAILMALVFGGHTAVVPSAQGEPVQQAPIAGGSGIFVMPAQFAPAVWGCYVMDVDRQTLCAYQYRAGEKSLVLTASRAYKYDLQLKNFNTTPYWYDVQKLVKEEEDTDRINASKTPPASPESPAGGN